jgi:ribonucleoside-diphosphate reductase alpha chain
MTERRRLPDRRASTTFEVEAFGLRFTATASPFDDGSLGEVFLQNHKADSGAGIMASDSAIAASLALQFGCPAEVLRKALSRDARGNASGPLPAALDALLQRPDADGEATPVPPPLPRPTLSAGAVEQIATLEPAP